MKLRYLLIIAVLWSCSAKTEFSPETASVLFMSNQSGNSEIYRALPADAKWKNLSNNPASDNWASWSPDGKMIVFQRLLDGNFDVWVMDEDGASQSRLTDNPAHDYLPAWRPDGQAITFTSMRQEEGDLQNSKHIYIMDADGSDQRRLVEENLSTSSGAVWSRDENYFVFSRATGKKGSDIFIADKTGRIINQITSDDKNKGAADFSPDGTKIAFYADDGRSSDIYIINTDGTGRIKLTNGGHNWNPHWSPDGKWIIYTGDVAGTHMKNLDIFALKINGNGIPILLISGPGAESDGRWKAVK